MNQRAKSGSRFEGNLWKSMNNSLYGKTMENIRDRICIKLLRTGEEARTMFSKPLYKGHIRFSDNLIGVLNNISSVKFDKSIYLGMCTICILDYSKLLMYQFYYEKINKLWPSNEIIGYDTDSFFFNIQTKDVYEDLKFIQDDSNTSNYPETNPLLSKKNKKVIGKFKDEL